MNSADRNAADANPDPHILRAKDIIPPYNQNPLNLDNVDNTSSDFDIPKFDLAEQILAQQRKLSAEKRKSPACGVRSRTAQKIGVSVHQQNPSLAIRSDFPPDVLSVQQDFIIIKDIVKRDIEKICRGNRTVHK